MVVYSACAILYFPAGVDETGDLVCDKDLRVPGGSDDGVKGAGEMSTAAAVGTVSPSVPHTSIASKGQTPPCHIQARRARELSD